MPDWIKVKPLSDSSYNKITSVSHKYNLHTVCQEALCPNINECWSNKTATFLLMGNICTRNCRFCSVKTGDPAKYLDNDEPYKMAKAVRELNLDYIVLTSVDRDDLLDGGAGHFARTVREIKKLNPETSVEVLTPDFRGNIEALESIISSKPDVFGHNIETVERLTSLIRDKRAGYRLSLEVLNLVKKIDKNMITKSSIQLGFGESHEDVQATLTDLRQNDVDIVTMGQYLRPNKKQISVKQYICPEKFEEYGDFAQNLGFKAVVAAPLARTSYKASEAFSKVF